MIRLQQARRPTGPRQFLAFGVTLAGHVGVGLALWLFVHPESRPKPPEIFYVTMEALRPKPEPVKPEIKPPPVVPPQIAEAPKPIEKPRKPAPAPAAHAPAPPADTGPPVHFFGPGAGTGSSAVASGLGTAGDGLVRRAPSDYADKVKARILANKVFPITVQEKRLECVVTYSVTVDRAGHMIAHHIDPCPYAELNALAEATIVKSGPFEPPENGAEQRVVYGSLPFHLEIQLPPVPARR